MFQNMVNPVGGSGGDNIFKPSAGDIYFGALRTGAGLTTTGGQTGLRFPQIAYDVSNVNSVSVQYTSAYTGNRGSCGVKIDGVYETFIADGASSTTTQTKTYNLAGKKSLIFYGNEDNGTINWGSIVSLKNTFS